MDSHKHHGGCIHPPAPGDIKPHVPTGVEHEPAPHHATIDEMCDDIEAKYIEIRHDLHENPELGNREFRTAKIIGDHLKSLGFDEVHEKVGVTGVVGVLKGGKPGDKVIGLRADFDGLPVKELSGLSWASTVVDEDYPGGPFPVAHACGHETHATMLMGACEIFSKMRAEIPGTIKVIFQPAEEGPPVGEDGGAALMVKQGCLKGPRPDAMFAIHCSPFPVGELFYTPGPAMASSELIKIKVNGMGVHGSTPWMGKDPMTVAAEIVLALAQIYRQVPATEAITLSIGKIDDEGRFNVIGDSVTMWGTVRCIHQNTMAGVNERITRISQHVAMAHGLTADVDFEQVVPAVINEPKWLDRFLPTLERVMGADHMNKGAPQMAYDDASVFQNECGGVYIILGGQDTKFDNEKLVFTKDGTQAYFNHNPHFWVKDEMLKTGMRVHCNVVMDFLNGKI